MTAVQQALEAENALRRVEFEAQQKVTQATAEAKGLELQKAQVTPQLLRLRQIEVQRTAVEKWNGVILRSYERRTSAHFGSVQRDPVWR